ncbi:MAG: CAP domain-containing protein [Chitinophagaceae bacterium]
MRLNNAILVVFMLALSTFSFAQNTQNEERKMLLEIHELINVKRSIYLQAPLKLNDSLNAIARRHSEAMASHKIPFGHQGADARDSLIRVYFPNAQGTGENVTIAETAEDAVESWWISEGHKANMLGDYTDTGIGVVKRDEWWFCTQIFLQR